MKPSLFLKYCCSVRYAWDLSAFHISILPCPPPRGVRTELTRCPFTYVCSGLNAGKPPAPEQRVRFLLGPVEGSEEKELTLTAASVPTLTDHPLGKAHSGRGLGVASPRISPQSQCPSKGSDSLLSQTLEGPQWG